MFEYRIVFDVSARRFFEKIATGADQVAIGEIVTFLSLNPDIDLRSKRPFEDAPEELIFYTDRVYWVVYAAPGPGFVLILNIGYAHELPSIERDWPPL